MELDSSQGADAKVTPTQAEIRRKNKQEKPLKSGVQALGGPNNPSVVVNPGEPQSTHEVSETNVVSENEMTQHSGKSGRPKMPIQ